MSVDGKILWQPSPERVSGTLARAFMTDLGAQVGRRLDDFAALHRFSVEESAAFWSFYARWAGVRATEWGERVVVDGGRMPGARWFPEARLNFAENLLRRRDEGDACVFLGEGSLGERRVRRRVSWAELWRDTSRLAQALSACGVVAGDRVAGYLPNLPEAVIGALAASSLGAVWTSCSPDFGAAGVLERFGQTEPKVLLACDGYFYNGRVHDGREKLRAVVDGLPSLERLVVVRYVDTDLVPEDLPKGLGWDEFLGDSEPAPITFEPLPFDHPLYILYSSGTTGPPKCIVHGAGGTLLEHMVEHQLHTDTRAGDRVFYFTTCGWMMWNWLVSALACEATLLLYDGSPFPRDHESVLFDYADDEAMTLFGTSAKYLDALQKRGLRPIETHGLETVRTITSTGSPLAPESFDFVYDGVKRDVQLASISGGTDIIGCFVLGDPTGPVRRGEIQTRCLGKAVDVFDSDGKPIRGSKGELVCQNAFPSMPIGFWNDPGGERYRSAYFERFPGVWTHGDYVELTESGGMIVYGRSDTTLNPGGVRIGTAEIYRVVEQIDEVVESLVIGQEWEGDVRVVLFVVLRPAVELDDELREVVRRRLRAETTPRHVPARIVQVGDIPRTKSGKISELAVREVVHGREVRNISALANPEALEEFVGRV